MLDNPRHDPHGRSAYQPPTRPGIRKLARQTFASPDGLDRAIHDAVAKVNAERHCHPLDSQQTAA